MTAGTTQRRRRRSEPEMLRQMRSLALGEAVNVGLQPLLFFGFIGLPTTIPNLSGVGLVLLILVQGSGYWLAKYQQIKRRRAAPTGIALFGKLRWFNIVLLLAGLVVIAPAMARDPNLGNWPGLAFWVFAVLEYVNYFHIQLMPPRPFSTWRPRTSRLARDLKATA